MQMNDERTEPNAEVLVKALRLCGSNESCAECPYNGIDGKAFCHDRIMLEAADLIDSLRTQLADSQRREQAAVALIPHNCETCKHQDNYFQRCAAAAPCNGMTIDNWEPRTTQDAEREDGK